jgi:hypothetical protein
MLLGNLGSFAVLLTPELFSKAQVSYASRNREKPWILILVLESE